MIRVNFSTLLNTILDHLRASDLSSILHNEGSDILTTSLIKAKDVDIILTSVSKSGLINFDSPTKLSKL
jgi:hypothetical protein